MEIKTFDDLVDQMSNAGIRKRVAVVWPHDETTRSAVAICLANGSVEAVFVGCRQEVEADEQLAKSASLWRVVDADDADSAAAKAVEEVRQGRADVMMKGALNTDNLLRAVLDKQHGILKSGEVLTHITVAEIPAYHKLLVFSDVAVIPYPTDAQRDAQMRYVLAVARSLGVACPKVVLTHCSEKVDTRHFPFTGHYVLLKERAAAGEFGDCIVDGPLDVKTALDPAALKKKGIDSPVGGDADILIFPDIEAGNTFYKTLTLFAGASIAGIICGATVPIVLPSRGDSAKSKSLSLMLAALYA